MLRFIIRNSFSKEVLDYSRAQYQSHIKIVNCLVLHPVFHPNKGPEMELYMAEEAVGLAKSLNWAITKGPFWTHEFTQNIRKSQGRAIVQDKDTIGRKKTIQNTSDLAKQIREEGWEFTHETNLRNGEFVHLPGMSGVYDVSIPAKQDGSLIVDLSSESEDDLAHEWRNKIIRNSIAKSSLVKVRRIHSSTFFTKGKVQTLGEFIKENNVNAVFINHELSPLQSRNLEKIWTDILKNNTPTFKINHDDPENSDIPSDVESDMDFEESYVKVFDRYTIILQIFAKRSTLGIARLQIELSFLKFAKTKLVRSGNAFASLTSIFKGDLMSAKEIQLEVVSAKQSRAIGKLSGSGESALEIQRRLIDERIVLIQRQIKQQIAQRQKLQSSNKNAINNVAKIALIGYTNAGKSALLNCILQKDVVESQDLLFQTLQTTKRKIRLKSGQKAIMLDTIGFISDLPHDLVESFRSTLEEVADADLVLHIRDISNPCTEQQKKIVLDVLKQLNFNQEFYTKKMIEVWNKIDLLQTSVDYDQLDKEDYPVVPISALHNTNIQNLLNLIESKSNVILGKKIFTFEYPIDQHFDRLKWLYENGNITGVQNELRINPMKKGQQTIIKYTCLLDQATYNRYKATFEPQEREERKKNKGMPPADW